jgi:tRNA threonylcarbamoyladenosine biosynthesis protein TsaE
MSRFIFHAADAADTARLGAALAQALPDGAVVALSGTLGAGKTQLVRDVAAACGVDPRGVTSPTFVLINEYHGRRTIYHCDAYRVRDDDEFLRLGPEEYFESSGLTFIEWAERVAACLPPERLEVSIEVLGETSRRFEVASRGERNEKVCEALRKALAPQSSP